MVVSCCRCCPLTVVLVVVVVVAVVVVFEVVFVGVVGWRGGPRRRKMRQDAWRERHPKPRRSVKARPRSQGGCNPRAKSADVLEKKESKKATMRAGAVPEHTAPVGRGREGPSSVWVEGGRRNREKEPEGKRRVHRSTEKPNLGSFCCSGCGCCGCCCRCVVVVVVVVVW